VVSSHDGRVRVDATFPAIIEEKMDLLSGIAHDALFSGIFIPVIGALEEEGRRKPGRRKQSKPIKPKGKAGKRRKGGRGRK
jgi:hypothetical protein